VTSTACQARTKSGEPCRAFPVEGSDYCFAHDPNLARKRKEARAAGGRARHGRNLTTSGGEPVKLASVADVCVLLERTARDLLTLENSVARARAVAYVCGQAVKALEVGDLEARIVALEEKIGG